LVERAAVWGLMFLYWMGLWNPSMPRRLRGISLIWGVTALKPIVNLPYRHGFAKVKMRPMAPVRVFVRVGDCVEEWLVGPAEGQWIQDCTAWELKCCQGINYGRIQ
jgi:hypothetical protein